MSNKIKYNILGWVTLIITLGLYASDPASVSGRTMNFLALVFFAASLFSKGDAK